MGKSKKCAMLKVVLDTSVCVAALLSNSGASSRIVKAVLAHHLHHSTTDEILEEIRNVLRREKFKLPAEKQRAFFRLLSDSSHVVTPKDTFLSARCRDPKDEMFLSLARQTEADYLISLDQDLIEVGKIGGTKILTPGDFLKKEGGVHF